MKARPKWNKLLSMLLCLVLVLGMVPTAAFAEGESGETSTPPAAAKTLTNNGDDTYTLSLSVTGRAQSSSESNKADVIVVLDCSGSMDESVEGYVENDTGRYGYFLGEYQQLYYRSGDRYIKLDNDEYTGKVYWRTIFRYYYEYTGQRYSYQSGNRLSVSKATVTTLASELLSNNTADNPDTVQMSLVSFATYASTAVVGTSDIATFNSALNTINVAPGYIAGTNWQAALETANSIATRPGADVYVIFVSDGNPTEYVGGGSGQETSGNIATSYQKAVPAAKAIVNAGKNFFGIGAFGNVTRMQELVKDAGAPAGNCYNVSDQVGLQKAFAEIIGQITKSLSYTDIKFEDNVTTMTSMLVSADPSGFTYTRSGGAYGTGEEWTGAPAAGYAGGAVTWDLGDLVLEDGVTYTVSFKVWPSQEAYDLVADLNNGLVTYESLTEDQQAQLVRVGDGYALKTNLEANLGYTQIETKTTSTEPAGYKEGQPANDGYTYTKDPATGIYTGVRETPGTAVLENPEPMLLAESLIYVTKSWEDSLDPTDRPDEVTLEIMDGDKVYTSVTLSETNNWTQQVYVAPGMIVNGQTLEPGHEYSIAESGIHFRYEMEADSFHPMLVDGVLVANVQSDDGTQTGTTVTVTNVLKGGLKISKYVTADAGLTAPNAAFDIKVSFAQNGAPWTPGANDAVTYIVVGAGGALSAAAAFPANGIISLKANEAAVIRNLPSGVTYSVEEINIPDGFNLIRSNGLTGTIVPNEEQSASLTNGYSVVPVTNVMIPVTKEMSVPEGLSGPESIRGQYEFTLAGGTDAAPMPDVTTVTNPDTDGGSAAFGPITYNLPGTYTYTITESGKVDGVVNDPAAASGKTVTVEVVDNGNGTMTATVTGATPTAADSENTTFTNTYSSTLTTLELSAGKTLAVASPADNPPDVSGRYTLTLESVNGAPMPAGAVNGAISKVNPDGKGTAVSFGRIEYTVPGIYQYTVSESGTVAGVTNGQSAYTVKVQVTDNRDGTLTAEVIEGSSETQFTNTYSVSSATLAQGGISVNKTLTGANIAADAFHFRIAASDSEAPLPDETVASNDAQGRVAFDSITFDKPGRYAYEITEINDGQKGYTYDPSVVRVIVTVSDNGDGTMKASVEYDGNATFSNVYSADGTVQLMANKVLNGRALEAGMFSFTLTGKDNAPMPESDTAVNNADGQIVFGKIVYSQDDAGKTYTYTIAETDAQAPGYTYDSHVETVTVTISDNGDGTLAALITYEDDGAVFTNSYKAAGSVVLSGTKTVKGAELQPEQFSFSLSDKDRNVVSTVKNNADGAFTFEALNFTEQDAGKTFTYFISEVNDGQEGYTYDSHECEVTVKVSDNGDGTLKADVEYSGETSFVNSKIAPPEKPVAPDDPYTGYNSKIGLWIALMLASVLGIAGTAIYSRKKSAK